MRWDVPLEVPPGPAPLPVRIADAIGAAVRAGRFRPGELLPSSRRLAETLGVHRNTVLAAFDELRSQGYVTTERAKATRVAAALPDVAFGPSSPPAGPASRPAGRGRAPIVGPQTDRPPVRLARSALVTARVDAQASPLRLGGGTPDVSLVPSEALARAYRAAAKRRPLLGYGDPAGLPALRDALASWLRARRGLAIGGDSVLVTRGSQMALVLAALSLVSPGDVVAVERFGYPPAWDALRLAGAEIVPLPVDEGGLDVEALRALASERRIALVYATPHHQYPTTVALRPGRRVALLDLAREHGFAILEDDYDHEFHFGGRPLLPLASRDARGSVVYVGTLSKILAPGLRLGFLVAHPDVVRHAAGLRRILDRQGDQLQERAIADLLEEGEVLRHAKRMRLLYRDRRDALADALRRELPGALAFDVPDGGMALWARLLGGPAGERPGSALRLAEEARIRGVEVRPAATFAFGEEDEPFLRIGYAAHGEDELRRAARLLADAHRALR